MRLDGLLTGDTNDIYTFDFDNAQSAISLTYDGSTIVIDGVAYGGQDNGDDGNPGYVANTDALWTIHFVYATVVPVSAAVWLFAAGLLGLAGIARRKTA